jgi:hypothetical protein
MEVNAPPAPECSKYVPVDMWAATPHAKPPGTSQASHGDFELAEAGQLEKSNADKAGSQHILMFCEQKYDEMIKAIQKKAHPKFLGIF